MKAKLFAEATTRQTAACTLMSRQSAKMLLQLSAALIPKILKYDGVYFRIYFDGFVSHVG